MQQTAHGEALPRRFHVGLIVGERRRRRARRPLRQREPEFKRGHAVVDIVDDRAAEHLAKASQMIRRFIMIAVRRMLRARTGPPRQNMATVPIRDLQIEIDIPPPNTSDNKSKPKGPAHPHIEPMIPFSNLDPKYI